MSDERSLTLEYARDGARYKVVAPRAVIGDPADNGDGTATCTVTLFPVYPITRRARFKAWLRRRFTR